MPTTWFNNASVTASLNAGSHGVFDVTDLTGLPPGMEGGFTIRRMIGSVTLGVGTANDNVEGTYAMLVGPRASMLASSPHPAVDLMDWYYHRNYSIREASSNESKTDIPFDIRTQRSVRGEDRTLLFVIDAVVNTILWNVSVRLLLSRR